MLSELNVIGMTVDQAVDRVSRFLDDTLVTDLHEVRIVHGHGTGQLRKGIGAFLKTHPQWRGITPRRIIKGAAAPRSLS